MHVIEVGICPVIFDFQPNWLLPMEIQEEEKLHFKSLQQWEIRVKEV